MAATPSCCDCSKRCSTFSEFSSNFRVKNLLIVFSNSKARPYIKDVVIDTVIKRYQRGNIKSGEIIIQLNEAKVFGFIQIIKGKEKSKSVNVIYEKVEYKNGLIEIYRKPKKQLKK